MKIGIIEAGQQPSSLAPAFGTYGAMIRRLLGDAHGYTSFRAFAGHLPDDAAACDGYVISGSACGVYDKLPWIEALTAFLRAARGRAKLVGICFGHQIMAHAFGGTVVKAPQGWSVGLHRYELTRPAPWMDSTDAVVCTASPQDQVVVLPPSATVHAASAFTPHAVLGYEDHPSISFQFHPEFAPDFAHALLETRRASGLSDEQHARALASFEAPNDNARVARWIGRFLDAEPPS